MSTPGVLFLALTAFCPSPSRSGSSSSGISARAAPAQRHAFCRLLRTAVLGILASTPCLFVRGRKSGSEWKSEKLIAGAGCSEIWRRLLPITECLQSRREWTFNGVNCAIQISNKSSFYWRSREHACQPVLLIVASACCYSMSAVNNRVLTRRQFEAAVKAL